MRATLVSALFSFAASEILQSTEGDAIELLQVQANKHIHKHVVEEEDEAEDEVEELEMTEHHHHHHAQPDRFCRDGIQSGNHCCPASCGTCGGTGCHLRTGGGSCCVDTIENSGIMCLTAVSTACIVPAVNDDQHRRRRTGGGIVEEPPTVEPGPVAPVDPHQQPSISPEVIEELNLCGADAVDTSRTTVLHSNLGGAGPDGGEPSLVYGNVKPGVNLKITATSAYQPNVLNALGGVLRNGLHNGFGRINIASDATVDITFSFVDAEFGAEVEMAPFVMTFFDSDGGAALGSRETIDVLGFSSYQVSENTDVAVVATPGGASFTSVLRGGKSDNPEFPANMSPLQRKKTFALLFEGTSSFLVTLRASGFANPQGRNIFFSGTSAAICGNRAKCSSHECNSGAIIPNAEFTLCAGEPCHAADDAVCCVTEPVIPCCRAYSAECNACVQGVSVEAYCAQNPTPNVCPSVPNPRTREIQSIPQMFPTTAAPEMALYGPGSNSGWGAAMAQMPTQHGQHSHHHSHHGRKGE